MRILFLTNLIPFPLDNGGKIKTFNTLSFFAKDNLLDLFCFYEDERSKESAKHLEKLCNNVTVLPKSLTTSKNMKLMIKIAIKSILSKFPFVVYKYYDLKMKKLLEVALQNNKYDLVYIDHLQLAVYWRIFESKVSQIFLDQHNCESQIIKRQLESSISFSKKLFLILEYNKLKSFENSILKKADKVIVLSEQDKKAMIDNLEVDKSKFINIPIPMNINYHKKIGLDNGGLLNILFLGTLSWYPNAQGIEWFVDNVVPLLNLSSIKYNLYIVGKDPSANLIKKCEEHDNIIITGYVDDVNVYIDKNHIMVVPIFIGSGMRVKILEALGKGLPVVSTNIGAEGIAITDNKDILLAEDEKEFYTNILRLTDEKLYKNIQVNGIKLFHKSYSYDAIQEKFNNYILNDLN